MVLSTTLCVCGSCFQLVIEVELPKLSKFITTMNYNGQITFAFTYNFSPYYYFTFLLYKYIIHIPKVNHAYTDAPLARGDLQYNNMYPCKNSNDIKLKYIISPLQLSHWRKWSKLSNVVQHI